MFIQKVTHSGQCALQVAYDVIILFQRNCMRKRKPCTVHLEDHGVFLNSEIVGAVL